MNEFDSASSPPPSSSTSSSLCEPRICRRRSSLSLTPQPPSPVASAAPPGGQDQLNNFLRFASPSPVLTVDYLSPSWASATRRRFATGFLDNSSNPVNLKFATYDEKSRKAGRLAGVQFLLLHSLCLTFKSFLLFLFFCKVDEKFSVLLSDPNDFGLLSLQGGQRMEF